LNLEHERVHDHFASGLFEEIASVVNHTLLLNRLQEHKSTLAKVIEIAAKTETSLLSSAREKKTSNFRWALSARGIKPRDHKKIGADILMNNARRESEIGQNFKRQKLVQVLERSGTANIRCNFCLKRARRELV
jgi:hypothetical protein